MSTSSFQTPTVLQKTVKISDDSRTINIDLPDGMPSGEADVVVVISALRPIKEGLALADYAGCLAGSPTFRAGGVAIQREVRDEW